MVQTRPVRLRYTLPALADLTAILDYIAAHSPQSARRVQARIKTLTDLLLLHPYIGRRTNDRKRSARGPAQAAARVASSGRQFQGRSSAMRRAGWSAIRASTSAR